MVDLVNLSNPLVISESRHIDAPAEALFAVLKDPTRHREFDGSTMLRHSDAAPIEAVDGGTDRIPAS